MQEKEFMLGRVQTSCLYYRSDGPDELLCVDFGGCRILKKKKQIKTLNRNRTSPTHQYMLHN